MRRRWLLLVMVAVLLGLACSPGQRTRCPTGPGGTWVREWDRAYAVSPDSGLAAITLREVRADPVALDFVVRSKIYDEDPGRMFLTLRGGGISVYDISEPASPRLESRWDSAEDVEGQDRCGDLLVVVARSGKLLTFDVADPTALRLLAEFPLETRGNLYESVRGGVLSGLGNGPFDALHTRIYEPGTGRTYAMVTATNTRELIAVDVTDPEAPVQVSALDTGVDYVESITIVGHHAFLGGFGKSETYVAVDIADPEHMQVASTRTDPAFRQMVSDLSPDHPDVLFAALWDDPGGLATFDVSEPAQFRVLDRLLLHDLRRANRVKLRGNHAFLPLEQDPGGVAVVDVARVDDLALAALVQQIPGVTMPYTLELAGDFLYVFGSRECSMAIFEIERAAPRN